jgi:ABC-type glycerol-3-phosphate transport system permease component
MRTNSLTSLQHSFTTPLQKPNKNMRRVLIYSALLIGALVFAWPFVWMAATSAKLERELFSDRPARLPDAPRPVVHSPYIDDRMFADVDGPKRDAILQLIETDLRSGGYSWPNDIDRDRLIKQTARGIYQQLLFNLPNESWDRPGTQLEQEIGRMITPELVANISTRLRRAFCIGQLRIRSYDLQEEQLVQPENVATTWQIEGTAQASLMPAGSTDQPYAELHYDFSLGNVMQLSHTFTTAFPVSRLHRIQFYLRTDDTWHAINLFVEKGGKRFRAARPIDDADLNWMVATWQEPGPDDRLDKIRTWTLLKPIATGPQFVSDPNQIKITFEIARRNLLQAWIAKVIHNYRLTFDYIPFWRYVATSLFLVGLNLIGTLASCSLVAYSFARLRWPGRTVAFAVLLGTMMIPPQVTMIPQFLIFQKLGWYNTLKPLWITSFFASAFSVFLIRQFMKGVPRDLEDAARLDGCGFLRIYWHIILPLIKPALAVVAIFSFLATWNEFMAPLIYLSDQRLYPLSFGLYAFQIQSLQPGTSAGVGMLMAGSLLMTLPVIAIFFFAQRYFLQGVTLTGIKA